MSDKDFIKSLLTLIGRVNAEGNAMPLHALDKIRGTLIKIAEGDDDEENPYGEGYSIVDDPDQEFEGDAADQWLKEQAGEDQPTAQEDVPEEGVATPTPQKRSSGYTDWKPREDYSDEHKAKMEEFKSQGHSDREAERLAGAHTGPSDFMSALKHTVRPSQPSSKMFEILKPMASSYLDRAKKQEAMSADAEKNPVQHAEGKMMQAMEDYHGAKQKALSDFLSSDEVKGLRGRERHQAITKFNKDYAAANPEHTENVAKLSQASQVFSDADKRRSAYINEAKKLIATGGQTGSDIGTAEGAQHLGGGRGEDAPQVNIQKNPFARFAESNKKYAQLLNSGQMERLKRVNSAKAGKQGGENQ